MAIERFVWTEHARLRLAQRQLNRAEVEGAIQAGHEEREENAGRADWLLRGTTTEGTLFEAVYDHPHRNDHLAVRIVSVWRIES